MSTQLNLAAQDEAPLAYRSIERSAAPIRLLVLLHGLGGNEENLVPLGRELAGDTLVVFPRGPLTMGPEQFAWFQVRFSAEGPQINFGDAQRSTQALRVLLIALQGRYRIPASRTVIAGFSQGAIMSANVSLTAPELVSGFGILSGRILPEIEPFVSASADLERLEALVIHGSLDSKLPPTWAQKADTLLTQLGVPHTTTYYPAGHELSAAMQQDFMSWLQRPGARWNAA